MPPVQAEIPQSPIQFGVIVNPNIPVSLTITADPSTSVCPGTFVTFTASSVNGGTTPVYNWLVNGFSVGANLPVYAYAPAIGDVVKCELTTNVTCPTSNPAVSNPITVSLSPSPVVTVISCNDPVTAIDAKPFKLKGGLPVGGEYSGPGVNTATGIFNPAAAGVGAHQITYSYTNAGLCSSMAQITYIVQPSTIITCGTPFTDIRDNQSYPTVQIGSQCWMAKNLNFGIMVNGLVPQKDNCISEKYCFNDNASNCNTSGALYQWNETDAI